MSGGAVLDASDISGGYGSGLVVTNVSARVVAGEVLCVLGRNGVGKSTLLKLLAGHLALAAGSVRVRGHDMQGLPPSARRRLGVTYCPQERCVFDDLSVAENLTLMRPTRSLATFDRYLDVFPRLRERLGQHAGLLSGGEKKLLSIVRGLGEENAVLLLDEPSEGVQYENVIRMAALIEARKAQGAAFIVVEQNLTLVEAIADRLLVLDHGAIVLEGRADEMDRAAILRHLVV